MEADITDRVRTDFTAENAGKAIDLLEKAGMSQGRIARCIVVASNGSLERVQHYIEMAELDPRNVIGAAEYDLGVQKRDLRTSFLIDSQEKFWIGEIAAMMCSRGYRLHSIESRPATAGPFAYSTDRGEGLAHFIGEPLPIVVEKSNRQWILHCDADDLELYDLNRPFDDESAFKDKVSCYILAKQNPNTGKIIWHHSA